MTQNILVKEDGPITYLTLNRPDKINALSRSLIADTISALEHIGGNRQSRVVVLEAKGKHFCAGHDLSEMVNDDTMVYREIFGQCVKMMNLIHAIPQPVIARVQGVATAAGCQLVAACDLAVAEENARFATPGVQIGLFCVTPSVPLARAVGRKRALEMLLTGRWVTAREAADWGLVNRVVPGAELSEAVLELARSIAQASPLTVAIGKKAFYGQVDLAETQAYELAENVMVMNLTTLDAQEGIQAFLEKRAPVWKGK